MKKEFRQFYWLMINLVLLISSILMQWFVIGFEPSSVKMISGLLFIYRRMTNSTELLQQYGFGWLWILSFIEGLGGVFLAIYVAWKIICALKRKTCTGSKFYSAALIVVFVIFLCRDLLFELNLPLPGYWLFLLALISSAIFEWRYALQK